MITDCFKMVIVKKKKVLPYNPAEPCRTFETVSSRTGEATSGFVRQSHTLYLYLHRSLEATVASKAVSRLSVLIAAISVYNFLCWYMAEMMNAGHVGVAV